MSSRFSSRPGLLARLSDANKKHEWWKAAATAPLTPTASPFPRIFPSNLSVGASQSNYVLPRAAMLWAAWLLRPVEVVATGTLAVAAAAVALQGTHPTSGVSGAPSGVATGEPVV